MKKPMPLPADVRLMHMATASLVVVFMALALAGSAGWLLRHPAFALQAITVQGEVDRNNAFTFRTQVLPKLQGNFFSIDLDQTRQAFESVPWVRMAIVHRDFPNQLRTVLLEHQPIAIWGDEGANTMVNEQGQVFEASLEDVDAERLPRMKGPDDESLEVARMYLALNPRFQDLDMAIEMIELTPRGSWRVETKNGARVELGRGTATELTQKLTVFLTTLSQVAASYQRTPTALISADLRHKNGYALRLQGVTTVESSKKNKL
ncbi:cell division protein FtsQ/DivIB [uncultured Limnohabitans sp.]|uniref:cell division protein FtsQ/DivIB n=1 Tax=uncultured Limnohabitans sp. TaxID=768543 RepID=UPI002634D89D|nr:cell division protein FtsQ/DivIB [uncultured Limnohabitans sp.]